MVKQSVLRYSRFIAVALVLIITGCGAVPIRDVSDAPVLSGKANLSSDDVKEAIKRAGTGLGWVMRENSPGSITGTLLLRTHTAVVNIKYDVKSYSITYADSVALKYDEAKQIIHKNYNGWVQNLSRAIQANLANLS